MVHPLGVCFPSSFTQNGYPFLQLTKALYVLAEILIDPVYFFLLTEL